MNRTAAEPLVDVLFAVFTCNSAYTSVLLNWEESAVYLVDIACIARSVGIDHAACSYGITEEYPAVKHAL